MVPAAVPLVTHCSVPVRSVICGEEGKGAVDDKITRVRELPGPELISSNNLVPAAVPLVT